MNTSHPTWSNRYSNLCLRVERMLTAWTMAKKLVRKVFPEVLISCCVCGKIWSFWRIPKWSRCIIRTVIVLTTFPVHTTSSISLCHQFFEAILLCWFLYKQHIFGRLNKCSLSVPTNVQRMYTELCLHMKANACVKIVSFICSENVWWCWFNITF